MNPDQIEYLKNWLFRANEDIDVIKYLSKTELESYLSTICMHAQQAVEKFLKAYLVYNNVDFPRTSKIKFNSSFTIAMLLFRPSVTFWSEPG